MAIKYCFLIALILVDLTSFAQEQGIRSTITGVVLDEENRPLDLVQVVLTSSEGAIIQYTFTQENGSFSMLSSNEGHYLKFSRVGFEKIQILLTDWANQSIAMKPSASSMLREVIVKNKSLVEEAGDTISYVVKNVRDGSESKLEDIIGKLPGLSVNSSNGSILYQGREIAKILLDGDDLTGDNYKLLSKGLSADWVEEIQVLKRFTGNRLLQGIKKSEDVALNIKIKEEVKASFFGKASAGLGTWNRADLQSEVLMYDKKVKGFWVTEATNLGETIEVIDLETYQQRNSAFQGFQSTSRLIDGPEQAPALFNEAFFNFQKGLYINPNFIIRQKGSNTLKSNTAMTLRDRNFIKRDSSFYFQEEGEGFSLVQNQNQSTRFQDFYQDLEWTKAIKSNQELTLTGRVGLNNEKAQSDFANDFRSLQQNVDHRKLSVLLATKYLVKITENEAIQMQLIVQSEDLEEELSFRETNSAGSSELQTLNQRNLNLGFNANYLKKWSLKTFSEVKFNLVQTSQDFDFIGFSSPGEVTPIPFTNTQREVQGEFSASTNWKKLSISGSIRLRAVEAIQLGERNSFAFAEPSLKISHESDIIDGWQLSNRISWARNNNLVQPTEWYPGSYNSSFRQRITNETDYSIAEVNNLTLWSSELRNKRLNFFSIQAEMMFRNSQNPVYSILTYEEDLIVEKRRNGLSSKDLTTKLTVSKYFSQLSLLLKSTYMYNDAVSPFGVGSILDDSSNKNQILSFTAGFVGFEKAKISLGYNFNRIDNIWNQNAFSFSYQSFNGLINYTPTDNLRIKINYEGLHLNEARNQLNSVLRSEFILEAKGKRPELSLLYHNILDNRSLQVIQISPGINSTTSYSILRSYLLLRVKLDF